MLKRILGNKYLPFALFLIALFFFIYFHYIFVTWDFMAYVLNAKYFVGAGDYYEWVRAPLTPFLLSIGGLFGMWKLSEYIYIALVACLHFFSCYAFSKKFQLHFIHVYALSINPFLLIYGLMGGTELLSLALVQLGLAYFGYIGFFLALASLTRYTNIIFIPVILFLKSYKKIIVNVIVFMGVVGVWLLFNYLKTGDFLTSIIDAYAKDIKFRTYYDSQISINHIILAGNYLIPLALLGILARLRKLKLTDLLFLTILGLVLFSYLQTPLKIPRYLFLIITPLLYFSCVFLKKFRYKNYIIVGVLILNLIFITGFIIYFDKPYIGKHNSYTDALEHVDKNCLVRSNVWVHLNYYGGEALPLERKELINHTIEQGDRLIIYYRAKEPEYSSDKEFWKSFPIIHESEAYIILGKAEKCNKNYRLDKTYLENLQETLSLTNNTGITDFSTSGILFSEEY